MNTPSVRFTQIEQEILVLKASWDMIGEMVNYSNFAKNHSCVDAQLNFNSPSDQRIFQILLTDFLSKPNASKFNLPSPPFPNSKIDNTILFYLKQICLNPIMNPQSDFIRTPLETFTQWLEEKSTLEKAWFPSIELEISIEITRISSIKMCGNISKHSFSRLDSVVGEILETFQSNGHPISLDQAYMVISEFHDWFGKHVLNYQSTYIAELLNNLRWGIYDYLKPEFFRSFTKNEHEPFQYSYQYPEDCARTLAKSMYWDLMNEMRSPPYFPKFITTRYLKSSF